MEASVAQAKFPEEMEAGGEEGGAEMECSGDEESETEATRAMVTSQNKKRKKSGGFQSMGECSLGPDPWSVLPRFRSGLQNPASNNKIAAVR